MLQKSCVTVATKNHNIDIYSFGGVGGEQVKQ